MRRKNVLQGRRIIRKVVVVINTDTDMGTRTKKKIIKPRKEQGKYTKATTKHPKFPVGMTSASPSTPPG